MKLFQRIERKILQYRTHYIYYLDKKKQSRGCRLDKGIVTIFHDYERHYHDPGIAGYSDSGVRKILEIERAYNIHATYNIVARLIGDVESTVQEIRADQHEIASHSYSHAIISRMTKREINEDIHLTKALFLKHCLKLNGLRCPQSRWSFKQFPGMLHSGMQWSAENDRANFPYVIYRNGAKTIMRMPIKMDDWAYEECGLSTNEMHARLIECVRSIERNKCYGAIGFHPWVQGKDRDRIRVFNDFIHYLAKQRGKIALMTFGQARALF